MQARQSNRSEGGWRVLWRHYSWCWVFSGRRHWPLILPAWQLQRQDHPAAPASAKKLKRSSDPHLRQEQLSSPRRWPRQHPVIRTMAGTPIETPTLLGTNTRFCGRSLAKDFPWIAARAGAIHRAAERFQGSHKSPLISRHSKGIVPCKDRCAGDNGAPWRDGSMRLLTKSRTLRTFTSRPPMALTLTSQLWEPAR